MSNDATKQTTVFPHEAAKIAMETAFKDKAKGDRITADEVLKVTGLPLDDMRKSIKTWAKRRGFALQIVVRDGYRIVLDHETVDRSLRKSASARRNENEALRILLTADQSKLDDAQSRRHMFVTDMTARRVAVAKNDAERVKQEFKLTERVPLRALTGGK